MQILMKMPYRVIFIIFIELLTESNGFNREEFLRQRTFVPSAVKSHTVDVSNGRIEIPEHPVRGGGDYSVKPLLGSRPGHMKTHHNIRGGYTGRPSTVKIGTSIFEESQYSARQFHGEKQAHFERYKRSLQEDSDESDNDYSDIIESMKTNNFTYIQYLENATANSGRPQKPVGTRRTWLQDRAVKYNEYKASIKSDNQTWNTDFLKLPKQGAPIISLRGTLNNELRLYRHLFNGYNKRVRPTAYGGEVTEVFFELSLFDVLDLDVRALEINLNTEMIMKWTDLHLVWDPNDFGGIDVIRVPFSEIWFPDIILINTVDLDYNSAILKTYAIVSSQGEIELLSHSLFRAVCNVDVEWYPFDQQTCKMIFAPWTYDSTEIKLKLGLADISDFKENPAYVLEDFYAIAEETYNPCCAIPFSSISIYIQLQRRTVFAMFFYIMPGILINICALLVFSLPVETGEKVGMCVNSMLAMIVFFVAMTETMPPTQNIPLAGLYYGVALSFITINIACSIYVLNLNFCGHRGLPVDEWTKNASLVMSKVLMIKIPKIVENNWCYLKEEDQKKRFPKNIFTVSRGLPDLSHLCPYQNKDFNEDNDPKINDAFERRMVAALETIVKMNKKREKNRKKEVRENDLIEEWKYVSRVLDRSLFILFIIVGTLFNICLLTASPFSTKKIYCPLGRGMCEGLTEEEIEKLAEAKSAHGAHVDVAGFDIGHDSNGHSTEKKYGYGTEKGEQNPEINNNTKGDGGNVTNSNVNETDFRVQKNLFKNGLKGIEI